MNDSAVIDPERVKRLLEGVGRCLWVYQRIEILLKALLPHLLTPGEEDPDPWKLPHWRSRLDSRDTLGKLIKDFASKQSSEDPQVIERYFRTLVDQRNDLVHHFFTESPGDLKTAQDLDDAMAKIRNKIEIARPLLEGLEAMTKGFAGCLEMSISQISQDDPPQ